MELALHLEFAYANYIIMEIIVKIVKLIFLFLI